MFLVGKLVEAAEASSPPAAHSTYRLFVNNVRSGERFLVDLGAEIYVVPPGNSPRGTSNLLLTVANGTRIATYGLRELHINLDLARDFVWMFERADVARPIIGADFLYHFGLLVDVRRKRLIDQVPSKFVGVTYAIDVAIGAVKCVPLPRKWMEILKDFPSVTRESPVPDKFLHRIEHEPHTTGFYLLVRAVYRQTDIELHGKSSSICAKEVFADLPLVLGQVAVDYTATCTQERRHVSTVWRLPATQR